MLRTKIRSFIGRQIPMWKAMLWAFIIIIYTILFTFKSVKSVPIEPEVVVETKIVYVYKEKDLPEEFIEETEIIPPRYGFTDDDIYLMTVLLCGSEKTDGDGEYDIDFENYNNHDQISLVLGVVMNRVMSDKFPNTVSEVIWASGQFSPMPRWKQGLPKVSERSYQVVKEWCEAYDAHDLSILSVPESHLYFSGDGVNNRSRERW